MPDSVYRWSPSPMDKPPEVVLSLPAGGADRNERAAAAIKAGCGHDGAGSWSERGSGCSPWPCCCSWCPTRRPHQPADPGRSLAGRAGPSWPRRPATTATATRPAGRRRASSRSRGWWPATSSRAGRRSTSPPGSTGDEDDGDRRRRGGRRRRDAAPPLPARPPRRGLSEAERQVLIEALEAMDRAAAADRSDRRGRRQGQRPAAGGSRPGRPGARRGSRPSGWPAPGTGWRGVGRRR